MKKRNIGTGILSAALTVGAFLVTGCTNSDYDFNNVDKTMGFGGDLTLPTSNTMNIPLKDILELKEDGVVVIDPNGTYYFQKEGEGESTATPSVERFWINSSNSSAESCIKTISSQNVGGTLTWNDNIFTINHDGQTSDAVLELTHVGTEGRMIFEFDPVNTGTSSSYPVSKIDEMTLTFPKYMEIECEKGTVNGNVLTLTNVPVSYGVEVKIVGLDFKKTGSGLTMSGHNITMGGNVELSMKATASSTSGTPSMKTTVTMNELEVVEATGKFNPTIQLTDFGDVKITGLPDFLSGKNVNIDLDNPQIVLKMESELPLKGYLDGTITSYKDSRTVQETFEGVEIHDAQIANGKTHAIICRKQTEDMPKGDSVVVNVVPTLNNIISEKIPDRITFEPNARADKEKECTIELGREYNITANYYMHAPLAFGENAVIEYSDTLDGWHKDLKDIELADGTYLLLTSTAQNKLPLQLNISVIPMDESGKDISSLIEVNIKKGTVDASKDGKTVAESPLEIEIREKESGALKKLDGLSYVFLGKSTKEVNGITLNARDHTLRLNDIKVKLVGQVISDFN